MSSLESAHRCGRCGSKQPQSARFCHRCGDDHLDVRPTSGERMASYVVRPGERVRSINLVTALLPLSSGAGVRAYEGALALAVVIPVAAAAIGWVAFAIVAAAFAVPTVLTVYLYDVNEWDDQPMPVVLACIVSSALLGAATIWVVRRGLLGTDARLGFGGAAFDVRSVLVFGFVAPVLAIVISLIGPLWLASRPRFDDMIDGLTFGAVSGAAYAAGETLMMHRGVFADSSLRRGATDVWVSIVANAAVAKPIVYGSAVAIAAAGFSGIGSGVEGFCPRFAKNLMIAVAGVVGYSTGVAVLAELDVDNTLAAAIALAWGCIVAAALIVVLRTQLHLGILEAALESTHGRPNRHEAIAGARCGECEMGLASLALFCSACGASVRATSKPRQRYNHGRATSDQATR